jgi:hypothetical protein
MRFDESFGVWKSESSTLLHQVTNKSFAMTTTMMTTMTMSTNNHVVIKIYVKYEMMKQ